MLLIKKIDSSMYEISYNKNIVAIFYDNITDVNYIIDSNIFTTDSLHEVIRNVKSHIKTLEVKNVG